MNGRVVKMAVLLTVCTALARGVRADDIAIDLPAFTSGGQNGGYSLGEDFTVGSGGIIVTDLAAFDPYDSSLGGYTPLGTGGYDSIPVKIYYVAVAGHNAGDLVPGLSGVIDVNNSHFVSPSSSFLELNSFTPVELGPGTYRLVASNYFNEKEVNVGNTGQTVLSYSGPLITFPADSSNGFNNYADNPSSTAAYPSGYIDGGPINRYGAGSFTFTAVPEPSSVALLALGGLGAALRFRRRRAA